MEPTTLSSAKRNLVLHFFVELPGILRVCMAPQIIVSGWENTFLSPFDGVKILTHSTSWGVVSEDFLNHLRTQLPLKTALARRQGNDLSVADVVDCVTEADKQNAPRGHDVVRYLRPFYCMTSEAEKRRRAEAVPVQRSEDEAKRVWEAELDRLFEVEDEKREQEKKDKAQRKTERVEEKAKRQREREEERETAKRVKAAEKEEKAAEKAEKARAKEKQREQCGSCCAKFDDDAAHQLWMECESCKFWWCQTCRVCKCRGETCPCEQNGTVGVI